MEKIIICAPTSAEKNYCVKDWLLNLQNLKYPNFEVLLVDNTYDGGKNVDYLQSLEHELLLNYKLTIESIYVSVKNKLPLLKSISYSHNMCAMAALKSQCKHMLHLETDVFPPTDVIEKLLAHKKTVAGALYYRDEGKSRKLMVWRRVRLGGNSYKVTNFTAQDDVCFIDGTLKKVEHIGLGCVLIDMRLFKKFAFRHKADIDASADTYFAEDCFRHGVPIFADTSLICEHRNQAWGNFGIDYN